jgi:hypothetical protein
MRSLTAVRRHYALKSVGSGEVLTQKAVGPSAAATGMVVIPLPVDTDTSAWIHAGDLVDLLLAPTGQGGRTAVIPRVEVVDERMTATGGHLVFLAVARNQEPAIAQVAGRGQAILAEVTSGGVPSGGP